MKQEIYDFIKAHKGTSFVELERLDGFKGDGKTECTMRLSENVILWFGISPVAANALEELIKEDKIVAIGVNSLFYLIDGGSLDLPVAKTMTPKKKPHWYPVVFSANDSGKPTR
jgi:hypothetical protein